MGLVRGRGMDERYRKHNSKAMADVARKEVTTLNRGIEQLLDRIMDTSSPTVIAAYEKRIDTMEKQKLVLQEKLGQKGQSVRSFDDTFRTAFLILSNPLKIWTSGAFEQKRMLLRIAFTDKLEYVRNQGFRTAPIALPFSLLEGITHGKYGMVDTGFKSSKQLIEVLSDWAVIFKSSETSVTKKFYWESFAKAA